MKTRSVEELYAYFKEHNVTYEIDNVFVEGKSLGDNVIDINIEWGDWKHDHGYCDYLMEQIGYVKINEVVTEENGSDCYSSLHRYAFKEWWDRLHRVNEFMKRNSHK